jgi:transposase
MPNDALPDDLETLKAMLLAERCESERLRQIIKELQRHRFGRRAETLPEGQMLLGLEDVEQTAACDDATADQAAPAERTARAHKRRINRGSLPALLPRIEIVVDVDDTACPYCAAQICLPDLRERRHAGVGPGTADRGRITAESVRDRLSQTLSFLMFFP